MSTFEETAKNILGWTAIDESYIYVLSPSEADKIAALDRAAKQMVVEELKQVLAHTKCLRSNCRDHSVYAIRMTAERITQLETELKEEI